MTPRMLPPDEVRRLWPALRERIERTMAKVPCHFTPEDVYGEVVCGRTAALWVVEGADEAIEGVFVAKKVVDWGDPVFYWWLVHLEPSAGGLASYWDWFESTTRTAGCVRLACDSVRPLDKLLPKLKRGIIRYECEV